MKDLSDEQLMILVNTGDVQMMRYLFERYNVRIYNYCLKITKNKTASEDIAQEAFYKVIKHRKSFNNKTFAAWIFTITRNLCIDYLKQNKTSTLNTKSLESNIDDISYDDNEKKESIEHLHNSLNKLSPTDRELIVLSRYEKLKYKEISDILNMSESAIKTRIHRALQKLKNHYFKSY
ncbi:MAG: RNA polymerase sigma factor [Saprospiraceae bacterium]|nr:RNA polymerase sigma factor [Saprospiraceae bacterium]